MDSLLGRYRNITVLLLVIFAQLVLLAYQVKSNQDVRMIRVWAVTAVTPFARVIEGARSGTVRVLENYVFLHNLMEDNRNLKSELGKTKLENQYLKSELETADRVRALATFQTRNPSKMIAARIIGTGTGTNSKVDFVDRGSADGVMRGMAVITPDGIVGRVVAAYPTAAQVLLITDPSFAAGVISQKHRVYGTVKGQGHSTCLIDYIQNEQVVEPGEMFYTSGDDRVFPKGLPVGKVTVVRPGSSYKQVFVDPTAMQSGLEEVLIILEGVHQPIPELQAPSPQVYILPAPPPEAGANAPATAPGQTPPAATEADRLRERYQRIGDAQGHKFGEGAPGSKPPDFNINPDKVRPPAAAAATGAGASAQGQSAGAAGSGGGPAAPSAPAPAKPAVGQRLQTAPVPGAQTQNSRPPAPAPKPVPGAVSAGSSKPAAPKPSAGQRPQTPSVPPGAQLRNVRPAGAPAAQAPNP
jgi:rod shape-determining protein MreC